MLKRTKFRNSAQVRKLFRQKMQERNDELEETIRILGKITTRGRLKSTAALYKELREMLSMKFTKELNLPAEKRLWEPSLDKYDETILKVIQKAEKAIEHLRNLRLKKPMFTEEEKMGIRRGFRGRKEKVKRK